MTETPERGDLAVEPAPSAADEGYEGGNVETEERRIKRRLTTAVSMPLAIAVLLLTMVLLVAFMLLGATNLNAAGPPAIALIVSVGVLIIASRGWLQRRPRLSFGQLIARIIGIGAVLTGGAAVLLLLGFGQPQASGPGGTIDVVANTDFGFDPPSWEVPEGEVTFVFQNAGDTGHTLTIEGREDELFLRVSATVQEDSGAIGLAPGMYTVYCDIRGHRELGMEGSLIVTSAPPDSSS